MSIAFDIGIGCAVPSEVRALKANRPLFGALQRTLTQKGRVALIPPGPSCLLQCLLRRRRTASSAATGRAAHRTCR